MTAIKGY
jgi:hypothetical protein